MECGDSHIHGRIRLLSTDGGSMKQEALERNQFLFLPVNLMNMMPMEQDNHSTSKQVTVLAIQPPRRFMSVR